MSSWANQGPSSQILSLQKFRLTSLFCFRPNIFLNQTLFWTKNVFRKKKFLTKKFVEHQKIFTDQNFLWTKHCFGSKQNYPDRKINAPIKSGPKTARSNFPPLICTNVARTYIVWTNVIVTVGICLKWSKEATSIVWSTLGH